RQPRCRAPRRTPRGARGAYAPTQNDRTCNLFLNWLPPGQVPLSLDWQLITKIRASQTRPGTGRREPPHERGVPGGRPPGASTRLNGMHSVNNQDRTWASPAAAGPVSARVRLPASKSITNRALVLAALGDGPAVITNPLRARDTTLAADALRVLGSEITESRTGWVL